MIPPLARRLQLVTGKGGTGKTTLVAALALAHAAQGKKPLVVELGHRASLARVLCAGPIDHIPREVVPGVHATNLAPGPATHALISRALPARIATRMLSASTVRAFLDAAPGVVEVATLDRIRAFVDETVFDPILIDGDATGHTRMLFALHGVLTSLGVSGPIGALLDRVSSIFADPRQAAIHLASLPTGLAIEETVELWSELRASKRVALGHVLLDRVEGRAASDVDERALAREAEDAAPSIASALALLASEHARWKRAEAFAATLEKRGISVRTIDEIEGTLDVVHLCSLGVQLLEAA